MRKLGARKKKANILESRSPKPKLFKVFTLGCCFNPGHMPFIPQYMAGVQPRVKTSKSLNSRDPESQRFFSEI